MTINLWTSDEKVNKSGEHPQNLWVEGGNVKVTDGALFLSIFVMVQLGGELEGYELIMQELSTDYITWWALYVRWYNGAFNQVGLGTTHHKRG